MADIPDNSFLMLLCKNEINKWISLFHSHTLTNPRTESNETLGKLRYKFRVSTNCLHTSKSKWLEKCLL